MDTYDVVVVGGGPAGGECSYRACVPGKALLRPGAARAAARSVDGARQAVTAAERRMARRAGPHITETDASHAVAVARPAVVADVILDAVRATR